MLDCLFCKIIEHEIPSYPVYESDAVLAFLDIYPESKGHTLVIPKKHYENILEIDEDVLQMLIVVTKNMSIKLKNMLHADGVNLVHASGREAQQSIFHFHMHIIPRYKGDGLDLAFHGKEMIDTPLQDLQNLLTQPSK